jgi:hypothetical protein
MSGTRITDQQVRLYMSKRKHHSQEIAAAKAGISVRSARRIEGDATMPFQKPHGPSSAAQKILAVQPQGFTPP